MVKVPAAVRRAVERHKSLKLDLGCGDHKQDGAFGIDARPRPDVDLVWNLEEFPWPLPDNVARVTFMSHFWEHIKPWLTLPFMAELHRIMQPGGQILIAAPYAMEFRFVQDPTHCNPSNEGTFCYWDKLHPSGLWQVYQPPCFHLEHFEVIPVGMGRDFNAFLRTCKPGVEACEPCAAAAAQSTLGLAAPAPAAVRGRTSARPRGGRGPRR